MLTRSQRDYLRRMLSERTVLVYGQTCWEWGGTRDKDGYGVLFVGHMIPGYTNVRAHRVSYVLENDLPSLDVEGVVMHSCDHPWCINPAHLSEGSTADNQADKKRKGRGTRGHKNVNNKLSPDDVLAIYRDTRKHVEIARDYGVHKSRISNIKTGRSWSYLTGAA